MLALALALLGAESPTLLAAKPCTPAEIAALTAPDDTPYRLTCQASLGGRAVTRRIIIEGAESSGASLDCGGGSIGRPGQRTTTAAPTVAVWSRREEADWSRPSDVMFSHCVVHGAIRLWGMGARGRIDDLRTSSRTTGHTEAAQAAAPTRIALNDVAFLGTGSIPLYVGPGVTRVSVEGGRFAGRSESTAVYLDAESAEVSILNVTFDIATAPRTDRHRRLGQKPHRRQPTRPARPGRRLPVPELRRGRRDPPPDALGQYDRRQRLHRRIPP